MEGGPANFLAFKREAPLQSPSMKRAVFLLLFITASTCFAECQERLQHFESNWYELFLRDLEIAETTTCQDLQRFPVFYNFLLQGGYWSMPSARMGVEGEIGASFAWVPPYHHYNARFQLTDRIEITANYRVFQGVDDPVLSQYGFGDFSEKGANIKIGIFLPEDSQYKLPGIAIGWEDFLGTKGFYARYIMLTQVFEPAAMEFTVGFGDQRIKGWFGGVNWLPFYHSKLCWLQNLAVVAEYNPIDHTSCHSEPHPGGRVKKTPINAGVKWQPYEGIELGAAWTRGAAWSFTASAYYNFGNCPGFIPKYNNPPFYRAPANVEPVGADREEEVFVQELLFAFLEQGFDVLEIDIKDHSCNFTRTLRIVTLSYHYGSEYEIRNRLNCILAALIPDNIDEVIVVIQADGFPVEEIAYCGESLRAFRACDMSNYLLKVVSPMREVTSDYGYRTLFHAYPNFYNPIIMPRTQIFFGGATGKMKGALGVQAGSDGFIGDIYYNVVLGYNAYENLWNVDAADRLNPSQLLNVRTDIVNYYKKRGLNLDVGYLQQTWNFGYGFFGRLAVGYFEIMYGGVGGELLYYPVNSRYAFGIEGGLVKKRTPSSLGFENKIRKLDNFTPTYRDFTGMQGFATGYYDWIEASVDVRLRVGQFLAHDVGFQVEVSRYFPSGLRLGFWYTYTDGHDVINGAIYHDKGVSISMPLDMFYTQSSRDRWNSSMSAWLRDVGAIAETGKSLFDMIEIMRQP